jgi:hypothetical protein
VATTNTAAAIDASRRVIEFWARAEDAHAPRMRLQTRTLFIDLDLGRGV